MSTGTLFPSQQRTRFMSITLDRYRNMTVRLERKKLPPPPFTLEMLRSHILDAMGDRYDGGIKCRYCRRICDLGEVALDHAHPLARGGSGRLQNIEMPCATCNAAKGEMTAEEFEQLLAFLEKVLPLARPDILLRLQMHSKLMSKLRQAEMLARSQGQFPQKKGKPGKPPLIAEIDGNF